MALLENPNVNIQAGETGSPTINNGTRIKTLYSYCFQQYKIVCNYIQKYNSLSFSFLPNLSVHSSSTVKPKWCEDLLSDRPIAVI